TMTTLESKINATAIDKTIASETLIQLKNELKKNDASLSKYLESKATEPYLINLQKQIAEIEAQRDFALLNGTGSGKTKQNLKEFDDKLNTLKNKLKSSTDDYQTTLLTSSPQDIKEISRQIFEQEVKYNSLAASHKELLNYLKQYEERFDELPEASIDLARMERERISSEKIYLLLEEKYQEALINEQSTEGNVLVLNYAEIPTAPSSPNRMRIILIGLVLGAVLGIGFAIVSDQMDKSVKSPEDIENKDMELLGWIPEIQDFGEPPLKELIVLKKNDNVSTDAFKSLRTMLRYSRIDKESKMILITSSAPSEGKTLVSANLAGSYALAKNKTVLIDCDLRKPRVHNLFNQERVPGFTDYLVAKASYEEITRSAPIEDLFFIPAGTIPPNPTEILDSKGMKSFLARLAKDFDTVILDSPPLTTLADSLILSNLVDETILVARAYSTELDLLTKSVAMLKKLERPTFGGVLLNGFNLTRNYGSYYYKYAYSYKHNGSSNGKAKVIEKEIEKAEV
ncbi:MAG: polysaccharide biosynthesis tyrosine autokinase, partial [Ignavibacteriae bacterium]|nr:polysaccharide biosynthesis tyrosine autokinase [Ignavibacteriota bacterium]